LEKVNATEVNKLLKQYDTSRTSVSAGSVAEALEAKNNKAILKDYIAQADSIKKANAEIKKLNAELEQAVLAKYPTLSEAEIKTLVLEHKWQAYLQNALTQEQERISQNLTQRIKELAERYATTLPKLEAEALEASQKVKAHLDKMGWTW